MRTMMHIIFSGWVFVNLCSAADKPAISAADLLDPAVFPDASMGMQVESATDGNDAVIITTGARFVIHKASDTVECGQRIGKERALSLLELPKGCLSAVKLTHKSSGAAIFTGGESTIRINGDSLLMVSPASGGMIKAELKFVPDYFLELQGNYNFFDPSGGISFFEHGKSPAAKLQILDDPVLVVWPWSAKDVFWAAVSPPKAYDWQASFDKRVIVHGSSVDRYMYPSILSILRWSKFANVLYLHNEEMWENWQLSLVPRDMNEYLRVVRDAHAAGMQVIAYASPHFFLKGTELESRANKDPHIGMGQFYGANEGIYLEEAKRLVKDYGTDAPYFDEMYPCVEALATEYHLSRMTRQLCGEKATMVYHCTTDALGCGPGGKYCHFSAYCPTIHAYYDFIYKGEGEWNTIDPGYTRYILSTYNTSNSIGVQLVDERFVPDPQRIDFWLRYANIRFFLPAHFFYTGQIDLYKKWYWPRLNSFLRQEAEPELLKPTGLLQQYRRMKKEAQ